MRPVRLRLAKPISHEVRRSLELLDPQDRRKYRWAVVLQMATSFLDLAGVLVFGMVGVIASSAAQGAPPPAQIQTVLSWLGLGDTTPTETSLVLAVAAAVLLVLKSVVALWILRRVTNFLTRCSAEVSARMAAEFFSLPIVHVEKFTSQWSVFALNPGVTGAVVNTLTNAMVIWVELTLLGVLSAALLLIDPLTTLFAIGYFGIVGFAFDRALKGWSFRAGKIVADTAVQAGITVIDGIATYREITVANRRAYYIRRYGLIRKEASSAYSDQQFMAQIPRYGMEVALILGGALLVVSLLMTRSVESAVGSLMLFLAAATRVMPSILRLNGSRLTLQSLVPTSEFAFTMADHIKECKAAGSGSTSLTQETVTPSNDLQSAADYRRSMTIDVRDLVVRYPGSEVAALNGVSFTLPPGGSLAVVGPSGGGKSTLADAILGVLEPSSGSVTIGGITPSQLIRRFPGLVAYVPQAVALVRGTVRENVALGLPPEEVDDERVWEALERAYLAKYLLDSREGLDTPVGERGVQLSGGQRQRLGIARALYVSPTLLVMDEATSALDAETEHLITKTLEELGSDVTRVTIAHRLATIRRADVVLYMEHGLLLAQGTFEEVRREVPRFDHQANLLGL